MVSRDWLLGTATVAMETISKVIRILAHSNCYYDKSPWKWFPWLNSKSVRHLDQCQLSDLETLRPLVAPSLRLGRYSLGPLGF